MHILCIICSQGEVKYMPSAHLMIEHQGLDPTSIIGTGKDGRITKGDVILALKAGTVKKLSIEKKTHITPVVAPLSAAPSPVTSASAPQTISSAISTGTISSILNNVHERKDGSFTDKKPTSMRKVRIFYNVVIIFLHAYITKLYTHLIIIYCCMHIST
jgi:pyruvate/2-oxoglutarate dehydrogenase complex dihydrolipoamide acyltransferase (E2) component